MEEVIQFVESKESGKRSAIRLLDSHAVGAISRYNRSKKDDIKASNSTQFARRAAAINRPNSDPHGCLRRQKPPPVPTKLPFAAQGENRSKLQEYLLDYYSSSTFNTCEHQLLPMMQGPPLRLMVDPEAAPVTHHTPVPVPVYWQEEVKAGLTAMCDSV